MVRASLATLTMPDYEPVAFSADEVLIVLPLAIEVPKRDGE